MKILLSSYVFSPSVGGIETVSALLAPEFVKAGHEVALVTMTRRDDGKTWPFKVYRNPNPAKLLELTQWCDVYFQNNISLYFAWPLLFVRRPWVIAHHTWIGHRGRFGDWKGGLKRWLLRFATHATISRAIANDLPVSSTIVGNPYAADVFRRLPAISRDLELVCLGRLVSDKGVDLVIEALADLQTRGLSPRLTLIGSGPEEPALRKLAAELGVSEHIVFSGSKTPAEIGLLLNAHQVLVVPSRWEEPFGLVALEGIACGCVVAASQVGGLPEAVGPCGVTFKNGNRAALTEALFTLLTDPGYRVNLLAQAERHLNQFKPATVAANYIDVFNRAIGTTG